MMAGVNNS